MKINSKRLTTVAVSTFATLALSSFSFCLGSRLSPYHMQIVGKYFDDVETYEKLSMTNKKFGNLTKRYYKNFVNISQVSKDKYFPNIQTYIAYPGAGPVRLNMLVGTSSILFIWKILLTKRNLGKFCVAQV